VQGRCVRGRTYMSAPLAERLGFLTTFQHQERFEREVVKPFLAEYLAGRSRFLQPVQQPSQFYICC